MSGLISRNPEIMGGSYCIRGTRITVFWLQGRMRGGDTVGFLMRDYGLTRAQVLAAKNFRVGEPRSAKEPKP